MGLIHGLIERFEAVLMPGEYDALARAPRAAIALADLSIAAALGSPGIVTLIAWGYAALAVGFAVVSVLPVCTLGAARILRTGS